MQTSKFLFILKKSDDIFKDFTWTCANKAEDWRSEVNHLLSLGKILKPISTIERLK